MMTKAPRIRRSGRAWQAQIDQQILLWATFPPAFGIRPVAYAEQILNRQGGPAAQIGSAEVDAVRNENL